MRLGVVETGHSPERKEMLERMASVMGGVPDVIKTMFYRPELFGDPYSDVLQEAMRGESEWSAGERELFAAFVSNRNQCPF